MTGTICRCALEKGRMLHRDDCPLYPGTPLRLTAEQFREHVGLGGADRAIGDRVTGWYDGTPYAGVITGVQPHHPGCGNHLHITVRCDNGTEMETFTDAVIAGTPRENDAP